MLLMDEANLFQQYQDTKDHKILLSFKGAISQEVVTEFGSMIRSSLSAETNTKKIFAVFIELAQNIVRYSAEQESGPDENSGVGIILLREKKDYFYLSSGNMVVKESVSKIQERCEKVNSMNKDELKAYYQDKIRKPPEAGSKGAGIGLIDIARKSDGPLHFAITDIDSTHSFLTLTVSFKKDNQ
ncbi:MAG: hypothetical protein H7A24_14965 [Leptospiraceae bacterium]|nr:SiaB family protein kinase [Leptospiraceae bacterium]MCP5513185.1 hypothetical protein [Leptospiraceae bacterium]